MQSREEILIYMKVWFAGDLQGTYLTFAAKSHAALCNISEESAIGTFNGEFWGLFASNQVNSFFLNFPHLWYGGKKVFYATYYFWKLQFFTEFLHKV